MNFPHLRVASSLSAHYGVTSSPALAGLAAEDGAWFLALTDRDGLYGAPKHVGACIAAGLSPGLGTDLQIVDEHHGSIGRAALLAHGGNEGRGFAQLCRAVSAAHAHGKTVALPRTQLTRLLEDDPQLTVLLGPDSDVGQAIARRDGAGARNALARWMSAVPAGHLVLEVVCHLTEEGPGSLAPATRMLGLAESCGLPAVLTNAVRYGLPDEAATADLADAVRHLNPLRDLVLGEQLQVNGQAWLKPAVQMRQIAAMVVDAGSHDAGAVTRLLEETERVAQRCALDPTGDIGWKRPRMPEASVIGISGDPMQALWERARAGVEERYGRSDTPPLEEAHQALVHEMHIVEQLGMPSYFLTVAKAADIIRGMGIRIQARGSGVGSVLNYALHTSSVEPISNGLIFERFLALERPNMPDIDLDVESSRRHDVNHRLVKEFGPDRATLMSMTNAYRSRGAVRDAGLALGMDEQLVDVIAKQMWRFNAREFREALREKPELAGLADAVRESRELDLLVDVTERLDRLPRHVSMHPCGIILSDLSLLDRTPTQMSGLAPLQMSQFDKHDMDNMGLIKLDVLGVRMQSSMAHAVTEHHRISGEQLQIDALPLDDEPTYELLRSTRTLGVFQLESPGQMELVGKLQPEVFNDLTVEISLFRPGPMQNNMPLQYLQARHGEVMPDCLHPRLKPILRETRGVVVFHEQVMRIIDELTGCGLGHADVLRRQLADRGRLDGIGAFVTAKAAERGFPPAVIAKAWTILAGFGSFGFAKAHGAAFALPTYQSAWLKRHYPAEFMAGLLTHDPGMWPKDLILAEARHLGVRVLPIDVQHSTHEYLVEADPDGQLGVRMALGELNGSSHNERDRIVRHQPFSSLQDFRDRVRPRRTTMESLARVGALDAFIDYESKRRHELLAHLSSISAKAQYVPDTQLAFDLDLPLPDRSSVTSLELRGRTQTDLELQEMRLAVNRHQMERFYPLFRELGVTPARNLGGLPGGTDVIIAGVRRATNTPPMRGGKRVVFVSLDDGSGPVSNVVFFHDVQEQIGSGVFQTQYMLVRGKTRRSGARGVSVTGDAAWDLLHVQREHEERGATLAEVTPLRRRTAQSA
ncbi:DNA polymerase III, alpha subunit [Plantibacter flavus]|uniref:DNA-directed DNA polymerase n=1 Tax=Plantibacter flavus TaxID=150123 RepID=A0A3N2BLM1_9MICO|nr:DNA polymerase III subunit alpha [Plantibacter flavus]ROR76136.1 DNA polymerase III alpha subunit [Plantibacter flavus]SMG48331.1 DNA polymerase III, alpha subunit [Plantibacter flavus]